MCHGEPVDQIPGDIADGADGCCGPGNTFKMARLCNRATAENADIYKLSDVSSIAVPL